MPFKRELEAYIREFPALEPYVGQFVLIHHERIVGIFEDYVQGLRMAYSNYEPGDFMLNEIQPADTLDAYRNRLQIEAAA